MFFGTFLFDDFCIDALNNNSGVMCGARVCQGFVNRLIGVLQLNVLADNRNFNLVGRVDDMIDEILPFGEVWRLRLDA